ncbi:MAG: glutathione S-transferase family protein [Alphaproteobacteria bacterium]|nr:glutathione S-transferase family protein [Alphaproteobacteria bacterium]
MTAITLFELAGAEPDRRFSPYCWRSRMALAHKGLEVEGVPWRFVEKERIAMSGQGAVPVLVDGGKVVHDSWNIAEYLEHAYPDRPSLFGGGHGRELSRFYNNWAASVLLPGLFRLIAIDIVRHLHEGDRDYFRKAREARFGQSLEAMAEGREEKVKGLRQSMQPMRATLEAQPYFGGAAPLYADYILFGAFQWARCISPFRLLEESDPVHAWRGRMLLLFGGLAGSAKGYPA